MIEIVQIPIQSMPSKESKYLGENYEGVTNMIVKEGEKVGYVSYMKINDYCVVDSLIVFEDKRQNGIARAIAGKLLKMFPKFVAQSNGTDLSLKVLEGIGFSFCNKNNWWELKYEYLK